MRMYRNRLFSILLFTLPLLVLLSLALLSKAQCDVAWKTREGTIAHALTLSDGSAVNLDAVIVDKILNNTVQPYVVVRECWDANSRVVVLGGAPSELCPHQTVDVQGTIRTMRDGTRAIADARLFGYLDKDGNLLSLGPLVKFPLSPRPWLHKSELSLAAPAGGYTGIMSAGGRSTIMSEDPPPPPPSPASTGTTVYSTVDGLLDANPVDGTIAVLRCKRVAGVAQDHTYFLMADDGSTRTLTVYYSRPMSATDRILHVQGQVHYSGGQPVLCADSGPGYDAQLGIGTVTTARIGTTAWAATFADGQWVYLTGQVVTTDTAYQYWSHDLAAMTSFFYAKSVDRPQDSRR